MEWKRVIAEKKRVMENEVVNGREEEANELWQEEE